ncbi:MAG: hypothetical protein WC516_05785 [Patescibacteria group bacterium]|jgi:hypothetical protein
MNKNILMHQQKIKKYLRSKYGDTIWVYLKSGNTKGSNYNTYLNEGQTVTNQSPIPIKALYVKQIQANSLIYRELGLKETGAVEAVIDTSDVNAFKICTKVKYNEEEYSPFKKGLGNKIQITSLAFNQSKIVLFKLGN